MLFVEQSVVVVVTMKITLFIAGGKTQVTLHPHGSLLTPAEVNSLHGLHQIYISAYIIYMLY